MGNKFPTIDKALLAHLGAQRTKTFERIGEVTVLDLKTRGTKLPDYLLKLIEDGRSTAYALANGDNSIVFKVKAE